MNSLRSIIRALPAGIMLATFLMSGLNLAAQDKADQKIPVQIIEEETPEQAQKHAMALGVNIDIFPTIVSAASRSFGLGIQPWFGINHFRIRFDVAHIRMPDTITGKNYFYKYNCNSFALAAEYTFGNNFDGFIIGAGIGIWQHAISHKHFNERGHRTVPFFAIEGGYIWKFYQNLYLEPCIALDIILGQKTITLYGFTYTTLPVAGEITVKFGIYLDLLRVP
jgi:hypothetical protein